MIKDNSGRPRIALVSGKFPAGTIAYAEYRSGTAYAQLSNDSTEFFFLPPLTGEGSSRSGSGTWSARNAIKVHESHHISPAYAGCPTLTRSSSGTYTAATSSYSDGIWTPYENTSSALHYKEIMGLNVSATKSVTSPRIIDLTSSPSCNRMSYTRENVTSWFLLEVNGVVQFEDNPIIYDVDCEYGNSGTIGYNFCSQSASITEHMRDGNFAYYLIKSSAITTIKQEDPKTPYSPDQLTYLRHIKQAGIGMTLLKGTTARMLSWGMAMCPEDFS